MKTTFNSMLFILLLVPAMVFAQSTVSGTVTDQTSSSPLPGVNVIIKGTSTGTSTDFDGNYTLSVDNGDVLVFSYIGFRTQEITYNGQATIDVQLVEDAAQLDEIVVIGYGSVKKEDLTGTADLVTTEDFNKGPIVSAQQLIQGKVAGVAVTSGGGAPGEGQSILIRGLGSISLNSSPLIVLDGFPLEAGVGGTRNGLNFINPNDIESMVVLKDASATAIYGARAANGVILITTKKGKDRDFKFNLNSSVRFDNPIDKVDVMTANQFRTLIGQTGTPSDIARLGSANTDWQDVIYVDEVSTDHTLSALGSLGGVPVRASLGYSDIGGTLYGDRNRRTTASLNLSPSLLDDKLKVELNARGMYENNQFANRGAIGNAVSFDPTQPVYDADSPFGGYFTWTNPNNPDVPYNLAPQNPLAILKLRDDSAEVRRLVANAKLDYEIPGIEGLTATINVGIDKANSNGRVATSEQFPSSDADWNGSFYRYSNESTSKLFDAYVTYEKSFNETHNLKVLGGYSYQSTEYASDDFDSEEEEDGLTAIEINKSKNVLLSYFGRLNYDYKGKYLLTATVRADASSKLNPDDRWDIFPSAALAWNIHAEDFMEDSIFNQLKLRVGYGEMGNVFGLGDYLFLTQYLSSQDTAGYQFGDVFLQTYRPQPINEFIRWEVGKTLNFGLDYSLFDSRISGSVNLYQKETKDLIANATIDPFTNFGNRIDANIGDMENRGIEVILNVIPIKTEDFEWSLSYNVAFNDNEVKRLPFDQPTGGISGGVGNTIQTHTEGEAPYSFLVYQQVYDAQGKPIEGVFVDRNGDDIINDDDRYIKENPYADVIMGLNTNINYKNWDLSVVTRANFGNYAYNNVASANGYLRLATNNDILRNIHADYFNTGFAEITENNLLSDHYIQEASFFKVDNITVGYRLPENTFKGMDVRLYGSFQNVWTVTDYEGLDPEIIGGIDNNFYPRPQTAVFGVNIDF